MDTNYIKFQHFTNKKNYCHLQSHFAAHDVMYPIYEKRDEPVEDFRIFDYAYSDFQAENLKPLFFMDDFVIPGIINIDERYFEKFRRTIIEKSLFTDDLLKGFAKNYFNQINNANKQIHSADFLSLKIRTTLHMKLDKLNNFIEEFVERPLKDFDEKIKFNWHRTDVIYLFHLLKLNKSIDPIENADLGRIIDASFEYFDEKEDIHKSIVRSRKHLSDFNLTSRSEIESNKRLRKLLQNDDFYNH